MIASMVLIEALVVGLSVALGAALALLPGRPGPVTRREVPAIWLE
jgi:hypothetical protein